MFNSMMHASKFRQTITRNNCPTTMESEPTIISLVSMGVIYENLQQKYNNYKISYRFSDIKESFPRVFDLVDLPQLPS